jgi:hypothetical protein
MIINKKLFIYQFRCKSLSFEQQVHVFEVPVQSKYEEENEETYKPLQKITEIYYFCIVQDMGN